MITKGIVAIGANRVGPDPSLAIEMMGRMRAWWPNKPDKTAICKTNSGSISSSLGDLSKLIRPRTANNCSITLAQSLFEATNRRTNERGDRLNTALSLLHDADGLD